jgi:outer membrane protein assembly factor BamB
VVLVKYWLKIPFLALITYFSCAFICDAQIAQFRGPNRDGVFPESGLLKQWPEEGPALLWAIEKLDRGFASAAVTDDHIYIAGRDKDEEFLTVFDLKGQQLWRLKYGQGVTGGYPDTRCTPAVDGDMVYLISGRGEVVCISSKEKKIVW